MAEIIGVRFKDVGKVYYFDPSGNSFKIGEKVIVETTHGVECGSIALENRIVDDESIVYPLKKIVRRVTESDLKRLTENKKREEQLFKICAEKIEELGLDMKLVNSELAFDNKKVLFNFTADGRVDFRNLVKELAAILHMRIELRQIGVRDEAKMIGGLGVCGRPFCCNLYMGEFHPVSIKMAKEQGLSLNCAKISGTCGRLMCCLKYEQAAYSDLLKKIPKVGAIVMTPKGEGTVMEANLISQVLKVKLKKSPDAGFSTFKAGEVKLIKDAQIKVNKEEMEELKNLE